MIVGTFSKIPKKTNSHSYGWARTWSENLNMELDHYNNPHDVVYLLHGANFSGGLNLFGGFNIELKTHINNLLMSDVIYSLDIDMPDYGAMLKKRKDVKDKDWCDRITDKISTAKTLKSSDLIQYSHLAIGDSHTAAYAPTNCAVVKRDGTTLFGQIKENFQYIRDHIKPYHKSLTISLGNIDVRHHICRVGADYKEMILQLKKFGDSLGLDVEYSLPWPIEYEGRRLPKTGYYKGQPFWGTREERVEVVSNWREIMIQYGMKIVEAPAEWYKMDPELYAQTIMESPQSVHLSPSFYRRKNWGKPDITLEDFF